MCIVLYCNELETLTRCPLPPESQVAQYLVGARKYVTLRDSYIALEDVYNVIAFDCVYIVS